MASERIEVQRMIEAEPTAVFSVLCDPHGHVAIDSSGMLMDADGDPVRAAGDSFVVHMDREALNDYPLGRYDVTVTVTSYYDWSAIDPSWREAAIFPVISEGALRATLGILARTVARGYPRAAATN